MQPQTPAIKSKEVNKTQTNQLTNQKQNSKHQNKPANPKRNRKAKVIMSEKTIN